MYMWFLIMGISGYLLLLEGHCAAAAPPVTCCTNGMVGGPIHLCVKHYWLVWREGSYIRKPRVFKHD
jgi:hypothetical protein